MNMNSEDRNKERFTAPKSGRVFAGLIMVAVGAALLARQMGALIPEWLFTWEALIIAIGLFTGGRRNFQPGPWMILILIGSVFIIDDFYPDLSFRHYIWPMAIIFIGLFIILKPRRHRREWKFESSTIDSENTIDINTVFGGTKKKVMSKDFKGGEVNTVFGGNDIDFSQADINGTAKLEANIAFGGAKLIVPAHWKIQSEVDCAFGSVEDKRRDSPEVAENKTLILKGSVVFGSIEIKSY
jgi:predicted membrane protein